MDYGYRKTLTASFDEAVVRTRDALARYGFGVLTEINVQETLKKKLNVDVDKYLILGACNPPLAYRALRKETEIGLLLPCNVIVYEKNEQVFVSAIVPTVAMSMVDNAALTEVAKEVEEKVKQVIDSL